MLGVRIPDIAGLSSLKIQLHIQNIFDTLYISHGEGTLFFPAAERQVFVNAQFEL